MNKIKGFDYLKTPIEWKQRILSNQSNQKKSFSPLRFKMAITITTIIIIITSMVVAAKVTNISLIYSTFSERYLRYNKTTVSINESQKSIIEKCGKVINKQLNLNGVILNLDGIIADHTKLLMAYSIEKSKDTKSHDIDAIKNFRLVIGEPDNFYVQDTGLSAIDIIDKKEYNYSIYSNPNISFIGNNARIIIIDKNEFTSVGINMYDFYKKYGSKDKKDFIYENPIPIIFSEGCKEYATVLKYNEKSLPFENTLNTVALNNIGFIDGKLTIQFDTSLSYHSTSKDFPLDIFLRNIKTGEIYKPIEIYGLNKSTDTYTSFTTQGNRYGIELDNRVYDISDKKMLKDLEIIMPQEHSIEFPIDVEDHSIEIPVSQKIIINTFDISLTKVIISPFALSLNYTYETASVPWNKIAVRLVDGKIIDKQIASNGYDEENKQYDVIFAEPYWPEDVYSILFYSFSEVIEVPLKH